MDEDQKYSDSLWFFYCATVPVFSSSDVDVRGFRRPTEKESRSRRTHPNLMANKNLCDTVLGLGTPSVTAQAEPNPYERYFCYFYYYHDDYDSISMCCHCSYYCFFVHESNKPFPGASFFIPRSGLRDTKGLEVRQRKTNLDSATSRLRKAAGAH